MSNLSLKTERLELIPFTLEIVQAEMSDRSLLSYLLDARVPDNWPPPFNDEQSLLWFLEKCQENYYQVGWLGWYFVLNDRVTNERVVIGNGGFKGEPTPDGTVEIGYSILPEYQNKGYGTEAIKALLNWAFEDGEVKRAIAETLPELKASQRLLEKCNFVYIGEGSEPGIIRFELSRINLVSN
ncbi:GNAT family N-acetyltransferase [Microseira wollei]|uniref:GCN5-related N-acetyltransferase n=1 Tax=Microseira wollei NIES-4236 TaxID=2530354 RepID=A0AAV3XL97_9CYAN|nr:GNAT family N-acetyltransferase [Microseira wollei]GET41820.1 GCN5-related N-acetyltransferase [Microseira wollei NIES-4236]